MDAKGVSGLLRGFLCVVCVAALTLPVQAADTTWQQDPNTPGSWFEANNWDSGVPTTADTAYITNGGVAQITAGAAEANFIYVGQTTGQSGTVSQLGGELTARYEIYLGHDSGATGAYELAGGTLTAMKGEHHEPWLIFSEPVYCSVFIGKGGAGSFTQTGGALVAGSVRVGQEATGSGTYTLSGGLLDIRNLRVGIEGSGTLNVADANAPFRITRRLAFGPGGRFSAPANTTVQMSWPTPHYRNTSVRFENEATDPNALSGLSNVTLVYQCAHGTLDVGGQDMGETTAGQTNNFALKSLEVGRDSNVGRIELLDLADNQPALDGNEALYVESFSITPGSMLHLNGNKLYVNGTEVGPGDGNDYGGGLILPGNPNSKGLHGDMDCDGKETTDDISPFVLALVDPNAYIALYGLHPDMVGDIDGSYKMDSDDINPFVRIICGTSRPYVPEPATLVLLAVVSLPLLSRRRPPLKS